MSEETCFRVLAIAAAVALMSAVALAYPIIAQGEERPDTSGLSPYWEPVVLRWEHIIVRYADLRGLDPDLVASVVWKESRGVATVEGPTGAVGLMCVKPFPWRPSAEELVNPWTNVSAGTGTLAHILEDGYGDVYYALAAYNGGWEKIHIPATRAYATDVLEHYVRAVAVEHGLAPDGDWTAVLAVEGLPDHRTVTVLGPGRDLARYTERPWSYPGVPAVPDCGMPHATVVRFDDGHGREARTELWLLPRELPRVVEQLSHWSLVSSLGRASFGPGDAVD